MNNDYEYGYVIPWYTRLVSLSLAFMPIITKIFFIISSILSYLILKKQWNTKHCLRIVVNLSIKYFVTDCNLLNN